MATALLFQAANGADTPQVGSAFFVIDRGTALLGPDGKEIERLDDITFAAGALSPDGRWVAYSQLRQTVAGGAWEGRMVVQSRTEPRERSAVPLIWGRTGSSFHPLWSQDSRRILICEQGWNGTVTESALRVFDRTNGKLTELKLPREWWPSDWSADGKRLLTTPEGTGRIAWVSSDGTGEPEFLTSELEVATGGRISPDGRRILCMAGFRRPDEERHVLRLGVVDLATRKRTIIDEPGTSHGYCWSPDGSQIAFTWQAPIEKKPDDLVRETFLITCSADGSNRRIVTSRKYEAPQGSGPGVVIFFQVLAWR